MRGIDKCVNYIGTENTIMDLTYTTQDKIYEYAKANIGSLAWSTLGSRQAYRNQNVKMVSTEPKCNLFVYEMILNAGYDVGTPCDQPLRGKVFDMDISSTKPYRPPLTSDWFNETVPNFDLVCVGKGSECKYKSDYICTAGDIITDGKHMGIVTGDCLTISAKFSLIPGQGKVVNNNWGFRSNDTKTIKIFRFNPDKVGTSNFIDVDNYENNKCFSCSCNYEESIDTDIHDTETETVTDTDSVYYDDPQENDFTNEHPHYHDHESYNDDEVKYNDDNISDNHYYYDHDQNQDQNENEQKDDNKKVWILVALGAVWSAIVYIFCCRCC